MSRSRMYSNIHNTYLTNGSVKINALHSYDCLSKYDSLKTIFLKAIEAVKPQNLISNSVRVSERHLYVRGRSYPLYKPCYVIGFGKAVLGMSVQLERALGNHLQRGVVTIPQGSLDQLRSDTRRLLESHNRIEYIEGARDNIPDKNAFEGAVKIRNLIQELETDDLLIVLVSGGGSALLPYPKPPVTLEEKQTLIKNLSRRGADIWELNCVRKQISILKGGGLAKLAYPASVISLVLSDIIGDPLDFIASGPTTPNKDTVDAAINVIKKYGLADSLPDSIRQVLQPNGKETGYSEGTIPIKNDNYVHVDNYIIGNNEMAVHQAKSHAQSLGMQVVILSTAIEDDVNDLAKIYANLAFTIDRFVAKAFTIHEFRARLYKVRTELDLDESTIDEMCNFDYSKAVCLIGAGEPTVVVKGAGRGGRNQQLALAFSVEVDKLNVESTDISFLSCGTDGMDGPTDAAGAIGDSDLVGSSEMENLLPEAYLLNNDSYSFFTCFNEGRNLVKTGHTGTNVMDIHLMLITPKDHHIL